MSRSVNLTFEELEAIPFISALSYIQAVLTEQAIDIKRSIELCERYGIPCDFYCSEEMDNIRAMAIVDELISKINNGGVLRGKCD